jgi:teichuronic acid biosynthesis glycosyltransferase TuaC
LFSKKRIECITFRGGRRLGYNVIFLSDMFPSNINKTRGVFVREQAKALNKILEKKIKVVCPVPYSPKILWFKEKYKKYGLINRKNIIDNNEVFYPRYISIPGGKHTKLIDSMFMFMGIYNLIKKMVQKCSDKIIIHAHKIYPIGVVSALIGKLLNIKTVVTIHGTDLNIDAFNSNIDKKATKFALENNDFVVAVSDKLYQKALQISDEAKMKVITNGVDVDKFHVNKEEEKKVFSISSNYNKQRLFLFVGRLVEAKGIKELLKAIKKLEEKYSNFVLLIIGKGPLKNYIQKYIKENNLEHVIKLIGEVSHSNIKYWFWASDFFVLPSYREGMPTVMFEAMATYNAIIISDVGGIREVIKNNYNGRIIPAKDVLKLYQALKELINDYEFSNYLSNNAYKDVIENYTWKKNAEDYCQIYDELLCDSQDGLDYNK